MSARGVYRGYYSVLLDDPDWQRLTPPARHVFLTMRGSRDAGIACLFYLDRVRLSRQTGYDDATLQTCLDELAAAPSRSKPWIVADGGGLVWLRNGLRYDPTATLSNPKHRAAVLRVVESLPRCPTVARFCRYYDLPYPSRRLSDRLSDRLSHTHPNSSVPSPSPSPSPKKTETETEPIVSHATGSNETESSDQPSASMRRFLKPSTVREILGAPDPKHA
jgi:hypothetical protein